MTVATLIKKLETMPQDAIVMHYNYEEEVKDWTEIISCEHLEKIVRPFGIIEGNFVILDDEEIDEVNEGWYEEDEDE